MGMVQNQKTVDWFRYCNKIVHMFLRLWQLNHRRNEEKFGTVVAES